jgi:uncharacterized membrane protein YgdD (TMEM256/DUF423 family)
MQKKLFVTGGVFALLSVVLGALAAHALRDKLEPRSLEGFNTAVKFMFYDALALLVFGLMVEKYLSPFFVFSTNLIIWGTCIFSGSIYLLSTSAVTGLNIPKGFGLVTPIGGVLLITGWVFFIITMLKRKEE